MLPTLIYDADCGFCRTWVARWSCLTRGRVRYLPFQKAGVLEAFEVPRAEAKHSVQLITRGGQRVHGAKAAVLALSEAPGFHVLKYLVRSSALMSILEFGYRRVANHRMGLAKFERRLPYILDILGVAAVLAVIYGLSQHLSKK